MLPRRRRRESDACRKLRLANDRLVTVRRKLQSCLSRRASGLWFRCILDRKFNRNNLGVHLPHLGVSKLRQLMGRGVLSGTEPMDSDDPCIEPEWRSAVESHFEHLNPKLQT